MSRITTETILVRTPEGIRPMLQLSPPPTPAIVEEVRTELRCLEESLHKTPSGPQQSKVWKRDQAKAAKRRRGF